MGATWTTAGRHGNALSFNGSSNLVRVASAASLNMGSAMTLSAWARPAANQSGWRTIIRRQTDAYFLAAAANRPLGRLAAEPSAAASLSSPARPPLPSTPGRTLALTYDGASLRLYVSGTQVATRAAAGAIQASANPLWIGGNQPYGEYFRGLHRRSPRLPTAPLRRPRSKAT